LQHFLQSFQFKFIQKYTIAQFCGELIVRAGAEAENFDNLGFGSESELDPHSMGSWIRIRIANADPDPEGGKLAPKKKKN
jgi:hypothetical protein